MTFEEIIKQVRAKNFAPIYFLSGEEPYFIDKIANEIQANALQESERSFNEYIFYGEDANVIDIIHAAKRFPMGAPKQLVLVREAQSLDKIDLLENYFVAPQPSTILVLSHKYKNLDKRKKLYTTLNKQKEAVIFESKKMYENQLEAWILGYLKERKLTIEPKALALIRENLGVNLENVVLAIDKLVVAMGPNSAHISTDLVSKVVGISKEYNVFELQNALINRDVLKANKIVKAFAGDMRKNAMPQITSALFPYFSKLLAYFYIKDKSRANVASQLKVAPFFVGDYEKGAKMYSGVKVAQIISLIREYDMKAKGFGNSRTSQEELLREFVLKILN